MSNMVLFIDSKVENYNYLISQVDSQTKVVILQPSQNGIDQISKSLGECYDVDTVHIISHGAKGALYLGNSILKNDNIHLSAQSIQQWGKCLSADGEILIYGCQVASGKEGKEFVRQLHQLTGANIAASETLTGNVSKGGNWNLEVIFGQLKSALVFTPEVRASYAGVLANIVVDTTDDVVDDSDGVTSLREAIIEANSTPEDDTIQLTAGATYNLTISGSREDVAATGDLDIVARGGEITVISEGAEQAVIDAGGDSGIRDRVFHVLQNAALELENVEITGGFSTNFSGGGIRNTGTLTINNSTIAENSASNGTNSGGGISTLVGTTSINNSTISGNSASTGGGIENFLGTLTINNSTISGNSAGRSGGGISTFDGTTTINNSTISSNSARFGGGGIRNSSDSTTISDGTTNINNSTISDNSADFGGGVSSSGTANISNSTISGNSARFGDGGGVLSFSGSTTNINDSNISGNLANRGGGISSSGTANISNSTISGNSVDIDGGGIHNTGTASISNSTISNNSALVRSVDVSTAYGGGIFNRDGSLSISNSNINGNSTGTGGGGIWNSNGTASISNSTINGNSAAYFGSGGGILNSFYGTANISNSNISDNFASSGGGISNFSSTASISNSTISGNSASFSSGGIFNSSEATASISNSTISGNSASSYGGISNFSTASISNSTITGNSSVSGASGIENRLGGTATVTSSIVSSNANIDVEIGESGGIFISGNNNLIGTGDAIALNSFNGDRDQVGITDPLLADLADNGGPTLTHLPLPNSPVINAGSNPNLLTTDQRGEGRFAGAGVDIGAVEVQILQEIIGTNEADFINGTIEQDTLFGLDGNDVINGLDDDDVLFGNRDLDTLNGDAGNDTIFGGRDNDLVFGNIGEDFLRGDRGSDSVFGQEDNDTIFGGRDNDFVDGGFGDDSISGDLGNDTLIGGQGIDTLTGGDDTDIFELAVGEGLDIIADFVPQQDIILLDKSTFTAITSDSGTGFSVNAEFAIVTSDSDAETSSAVIVYNSNNGKLFYNVNGTEAEFGSGGEFANLTNIASISEDDFFLRG